MNVFEFSSGNSFKNLLNSYTKRPLNDGFNVAAIRISVTNSHSSQTLSCTL